MSRVVCRAFRSASLIYLLCPSFSEAIHLEYWVVRKCKRASDGQSANSVRSAAAKHITASLKGPPCWEVNCPNRECASGVGQTIAPPITNLRPIPICLNLLYHPLSPHYSDHRYIARLLMEFFYR